ncbi:MAG: sugar phosphate isomerase/epimerase, partial [Planctomycetota bacterium]|nr:sugar phosphate isomerase/epimerase [Planctomycetota bacterium]
MAHTRRTFLGNSAKLAAFATTSSAFPSCVSAPLRPKMADFEISLAQWSLHRAFGAGDLDNLDFAKMARHFDINAIEYVNQFFHDKSLDENYIAQMKQRADDMGVQSLLIMCDGDGNLGDPSATQREIAVQKHRQW